MQLNRILVAHDFSVPAQHALAFAAELGQRVGAQLEIVHVYPELVGSRQPGGPVAGSASPDQEQRYLRFLERELEHALRSALAERAQEVKCHLLRGDPVARIEALANELGADVICVGSTGKGAVERAVLGRVSQRILRTSTRPVLTVHG